MACLRISGYKVTSFSADDEIFLLKLALDLFHKPIYDINKHTKDYANSCEFMQKRVDS